MMDETTLLKWQKRYVELTVEYMKQPSCAMPPEKENERRAIKALLELRTELATVKARLEEAEGLLQACREVKTHIDAIHPDGLAAKYSECYWGMKQVFSEINALDQGQEIPEPEVQ